MSGYKPDALTVWLAADRDPSRDKNRYGAPFVSVIVPDVDRMAQCAPVDVRMTHEPATAGNVMLEALFPVSPGRPAQMTLPASCDDVRTCALGDVDLKICIAPALEAAGGRMVVMTPCDAERIVTPASRLVIVEFAVLVWVDADVVVPSNPDPGSAMMPRSVTLILTMVDK